MTSLGFVAGCSLGGGRLTFTTNSTPPRREQTRRSRAPRAGARTPRRGPAHPGHRAAALDLSPQPRLGRWESNCGSLGGAPRRLGRALLREGAGCGALAAGTRAPPPSPAPALAPRALSGDPRPTQRGGGASFGGRATEEQRPRDGNLGVGLGRISGHALKGLA